MMTRARFIVTIAAVLAVLAAGTFTVERLAAQRTGRAAHQSDQQTTGPYNVVPDWSSRISEWPGHKGWTWGAVQGIFAENPNKIFIAQRGELPALLPKQKLNLVHLEGEFGPVAVQFPFVRQNRSADSPGEAGPYPGRVEGKDYRWEHVITIVDGQGNLVDAWTQWDSLFKPQDIPNTGRGRVHKILISPYDPEKRVWVIDDGNQVIHIFSNDGKKLLQTIGTPRVTTERNANSLTKQHGPAEKTFGRQTDIAWLPDGTFFVADGYEETRVVKFDKDGKYLMAWGEKGEAGKETRPGYFNTVHGIVIDKNRRIYVNDRSNHRVQIYDENGKYLDEWYFGPYATVYHLYITVDQHIWASDSGSVMQKYDLNGTMLYSWGEYGLAPGELWGVHQFSVDQDGNLYVAEVHGGRPQKFTPKPGADPAKLVGQPLRVAWK